MNEWVGPFPWCYGHSTFHSPSGWTPTHPSWLNTSIVSSVRSSLWFSLRSPLSPLCCHCTLNCCLRNYCSAGLSLLLGLNVLDRTHGFSMFFISGALRSAWFTVGSQPMFDEVIQNWPQSVGFTHQRTPSREQVKGHGNALNKIRNLPRGGMGLFLPSSFLTMALYVFPSLAARTVLSTHSKLRRMEGGIKEPQRQYIPANVEFQTWRIWSSLTNHLPPAWSHITENSLHNVAFTRRLPSGLWRLWAGSWVNIGHTEEPLWALVVLSSSSGVWSWFAAGAKSLPSPSFFFFLAIELLTKRKLSRV